MCRATPSRFLTQRIGDSIAGEIELIKITGRVSYHVVTYRCSDNCLHFVSPRLIGFLVVVDFLNEVPVSRNYINQQGHDLLLIATAVNTPCCIQIILTKCID